MTSTRTEYQREWRVAKREKVRAGALEVKHGVASSYAAGCRCDECKHAKMVSVLPTRLIKYGLTHQQYEDRMRAQNFSCKICKTPFDTSNRFCVDHDHTCCAGKTSCGKCVRGFLCNPCNMGLGNFKDSIARLESALTYMKEA